MMLSRRSLQRLRYQHDADIASWLTNKSAASGKYREASLSFNTGKSEQHHDNLKVCKFLSEKHQSYPQGGADPNGNGRANARQRASRPRRAYSVEHELEGSATASDLTLKEAKV
jgi:hypothetical protein